MKLIVNALILSTFFAFSAMSVIEFDPNRLSKQPSGWSNNGNSEKFYGYSYDHNLVFHVLERFVPAVNSLIADAMEKCLKIGVINSDIIFITSQEDIKNMLSLVEPECSFIEIHPSKLTLNSIGFHSFRKFFMKFSTDESRIELSKTVYRDMKKKRTLALASKKLLRIDSNKLEGNHGCTTLINDNLRDDENDKCVVCLNAKKEIVISPCNHMCLCENCSKQVDKNCPICRKNISAKSRVYY